MTGRLPELGDPVMLGRTRLAWHAVAEQVLAALRYAADSRIGLTVTRGGFGTPTDAACRPVRVAGDELLVLDGDRERVEPLTTLAAAAAAVGIEAGAPPVYPPATSWPADAPLEIDVGAAGVLAAWFELGWSALGELGGQRTLWPEHFDAATDVGDEARGARGTFGASPGDADHPEPYLYVTPWSEVAADGYWNDDAFGGASLGYHDVAAAPDPMRAASTFYATGRRLLTRA